MRKAKCGRNLRALILLGVLVNVIGVLGGGAMVFVGYHDSPSLVMPVWKAAQGVLIYSAANLVVHVFVAWHALRQTGDGNATSPQDRAEGTAGKEGSSRRND